MKGAWGALAAELLRPGPGVVGTRPVGCGWDNEGGWAGGRKLEMGWFGLFSRAERHWRTLSKSALMVVREESEEIGSGGSKVLGAVRFARGVLVTSVGLETDKLSERYMSTSLLDTPLWLHFPSVELWQHGVGDLGALSLVFALEQFWALWREAMFSASWEAVDMSSLMQFLCHLLTSAAMYGLRHWCSAWVSRRCHLSSSQQKSSSWGRNLAAVCKRVFASESWLQSTVGIESVQIGEQGRGKWNCSLCQWQ